VTPFSEPWRSTALRTGSLALGIGIVAGIIQHRLAAVPLVTLFALWFTLGGHFIELWFRNRLGPRVRGTPARQAVARIVYWFAGGSLLYAAALVTRAALADHNAVLWPWWTGGVLFVAAELLIHLLMRARQQPSFYDGRG